MNPQIKIPEENRMSGEILKVKNNIPPLGEHVMPRPDIFKLIDRGLSNTYGFNRKITLVAAPAGFGKTTLVRKWLEGRESQTGWYSIDEGDNNPKRFWLYLISGLQNTAPHLGKSVSEALELESHTNEISEGIKDLLTPLINELLSLENPIYFVLDDYHLINHTQIHQDMLFLLEHLPPSIHFFVTTRSDPPWPLHKWRAKTEMLDIRLHELKFSKEEVSRLYHDVLGIQLKAQQIDILYEKTEGWITALQLAAFSLSKASDLDLYIHKFAGNQRYIFHFLKEEVLNQQPDHVKEFLFLTSILNRLSAPLCDAVTGRADSGDILTQLERDNLFVIPMDEEGIWYRYHPLFSDHLLAELKRDATDKYAILHEKAGDWYLAAGEPWEALRHVYTGGHIEKMAQILHDQYEKLLYVGATRELIEYLEVLPWDVLKKYPRLVATKAFYLVFLRRSEDPKPYLELAEELSYENPSEQQEYEGILSAVKAYYNINAYRFSEAIKHADKALELLPERDGFWRLGINIVSGDIKLFSCNPNGSYPYYLKALQENQKHEQHYFTITTGLKVAINLYYLGRLKETEELLNNLVALADGEGLSHLSKVGNLWVLMGEVYRQQGNITEAENCLEKGLSLSQPDKLYFAWNLLFSISLSFSKSNYHDGLQTVQKIKAINSEVKLPSYITFSAAAWEAKLLFSLGEYTRAEELLKKVGILDNNPVQGGRERGYLILALLMMEEKNGARKALRILHEIEDIAFMGGHLMVLMETKLVKAYCEEKLGNTDEAAKHLEKALAMGYDTGYYQLFIDELRLLGPGFSTVFSRLLKAPGSENFISSKGIQEYAENILSEIYGRPPERDKSQVQDNSQARDNSRRTVEDLTYRELEILRLISQGLTNQDICEQLHLTLSTVKWHTSNIYGKLGVKGRTQAVALARKLDLLP